MNVRTDVVAAESTALDECGVRMVDPGKVAAVRAVMPDQGDVEDLAEVFALLGDPGRLRLLTSLLEGGELCVATWPPRPA